MLCSQFGRFALVLSVALILGQLVAAGGWVVYGNSPESQLAFPAQILDLGAGARKPPVVDMNGDEFLDVIALAAPVATGQPNRVAVSLGHGNGSFSPPSYFDAPGAEDQVAVGNMNNDQRQDVITMSPAADTVSVYMALAAGGFTSGVSFPGGNDIQGIVVGDFNRDNNLDVVTANGDDDTLSLLLGDGLGALGTRTIITTTNNPTGLLAADFNLDGTPDLAHAALFTVLIANGDGTFAAPASYLGTTGQHRLAAGDLDNDGDLDVCIGATNSTIVNIYGNNGTGVFTPIRSLVAPFIMNTRDVAIFDVDNNGKRDVVALTSSNDTISVFPGLGDLSFGDRQTFDVFGGSMLPGDFDRDSDTDLIVFEGTGGTYLENIGPGYFLSWIGFPGVSGPLATGELNGDRFPDIVQSGGSGTDHLFVTLSAAGGGYAEPAAYGGALFSDLTLVDYSRDGILDVVGTVFRGDEIAVRPGIGDGTFGAEIRYPIGGDDPVQLIVADFNGDTFLEVVTVNDTTADISVLPGSEAGWGSNARLTTNGIPQRIVVGHFNGDSDLDMVALTDEDSVAAFMGDGLGGFGEPFHSDCQAARGLAAGDFNRDGNLDLATGAFFDNLEPHILIGNGQGGFSSPKGDIDFDSAAVQIADLNGDNLLDIVAPNGRATWIWLGRGDGTFYPPLKYQSLLNTVDLEISDLNGDTRPDIARSISSGGKFSVLFQFP